jgi:hypothetical protein
MRIAVIADRTDADTSSVISCGNLPSLPRDSHLTGAEGCGPAQKVETGWLLAKALRSQPESVCQLVRARQRRRSPNQLQRTR